MSDISATLKSILQGYLSENQAENQADKQVNPVELDDATLINSLGLESVVVMEFVTDVEDHFDINIDLDSLASIQTLGDLAEAIKEQGGA